MGTMIAKRLLRGALTVLIVVVLIFVLLRVVPGDPAALLAGENATDEQIEAMREEWGLNKPLGEQFLVYVRSLLKGDAGMSYQYAVSGTPIWKVTDLVKIRLGNTIQLSVTAILISVFVSIPVGIYMALHDGSILDTLQNVLNFVVLSFPVFFSGIILMMLFSLKLKWFPSGGSDSWKSIILPAVTLSLHFNVTLMKMTKTEVGRNLTSDYIRMCRAKGLSSTAVLFIHGLRNAAIPLVTLIGLRFGAMLGGSVVVESLFNWPGIGNLLITAVKSRDYPTVQFLVPYVAVVFILINIVVDILYGILDPRIHSKN